MEGEGKGLMNAICRCRTQGSSQEATTTEGLAKPTPVLDEVDCVKNNHQRTAQTKLSETKKNVLSTCS